MQEIHYTIRQLQHFVAVAETGSISRAVERTYTSQPGISLSISELERGIGVKLLIRQRAKGVTLTRAGKEFLEHARGLLTTAETLQAHMDSERGSLSGRLSIGCNPALEPVMLSPLLAGFHKDSPNVAVEFQEGPQPELEQGLRDGTTELALVYDDHLSPGLTGVVIDVVTPYVLLPAGHRFAEAADVSLADLASEPMILVDNSPSRENWAQTMAALGIEPRIGHASRNFEFVRCLVGRGLGYSFLMQRPVSDVTYEGTRVVAKRIRERMPTTTIVLAYVKGSRLSPRALRFIEFVSEEIRERRKADELADG
ncbi:LysR family transcriptional regulator [Microbacterium tumbae]